MTPRTICLPLLALLLAGASGCSRETGGDVTPASTSPPSAKEGQVVIKGIAFNPKEVRATVGQDVVWIFDDGGLEHTVTADDSSFDSGRKAKGLYAHAFGEPGTFAYHCAVHVRMHGTVVVVAR